LREMIKEFATVLRIEHRIFQIWSKSADHSTVIFIWGFMSRIISSGEKCRWTSSPRHKWGNKHRSIEYLWNVNQKFWEGFTMLHSLLQCRESVSRSSPVKKWWCFSDKLRWQIVLTELVNSEEMSLSWEASSSGNSQQFMGPSGLLPCLQKPATGSCPEPD
jgi:hypothetical protein